MVGAAGFEPATLRTRTVRATKLRYAPTAITIPRPRMVVNLGFAGNFEVASTAG
jgi:hypothetical protein